MSLPLHIVTAEAMALDPSDRMRLASELIDSVEGAEDPAWEGAWAAELDHRASEADQRGERGRPWDEVRADILGKLARR